MLSCLHQLLDGFEWFADRPHTLRSHTRLILCTASTLFLLTVSTAAAEAQKAVAGTSTTFDVYLRDMFQVPPGWKPLKAVGVWHALPTVRPWSRGIPQTAGGAYDVSYTPGGRLELEKDKHSSHVNFTVKNVPTGTKLEFHTAFKVVSSDRSLSPEAARIRWGDFNTRDLPALKPNPIDADTLRVIDEIKRSQPDPVATLRAVSNWVHGNIKWDPNSPQRDTDTLTTLKTKRGHCGHQSELFCAMAGHLGIPARKTFGINLQPPKAGHADSPLAQYKKGFQHTWNEVYFPRFGWIEVDVEEEDMFNIPAAYIQNNSAFHNFAEWIYDFKGNPSCLRNNFDLAPQFDLKEMVLYR